MAIRKAEAIWKGNLKDGKGELSVESGSLKNSYSFGSRFKDDGGTNPEELIGAALAGCFSMALAKNLADKDYKPEKIHTTAAVKLDQVEGEFKISNILLNMEAEVPDIDEGELLELAQQAKDNCIVARALQGTEIVLESRHAVKK